MKLGEAGLLGWTSWIGTRRSEDDAMDLVLEPHVDAGLAPPKAARPRVHRVAWRCTDGRNQPRRLVRQAQRRSPTAPSRAPPCSASCAATPTSSSLHWVHQILQLQDSDLHRIVRHFEVDLAALAKEIDGGARSSPPRRDVRLRSLGACRGGRGAGLGARHTDVRRGASAHRPSRARCIEDARTAERAAGDVARIRQDQAGRAEPTASPPSSAARPRTASALQTAPGSPAPPRRA